MTRDRRDVPKGKQADSDLRDSEAFYLGVLNSLTANICVLDSNGRIIATNRAWDRFAQENSPRESAGNYLGANYFEVCRLAAKEGDERATEALEGLVSVQQGRRPRFELEYPCHSPDQERWFVMCATPLDLSSGSIVVAHQDITDLRRIEAQLRQSQKMEAIGQLAGGVAHDFRNQLTVIKGYGEMLLRRSLVKEEGLSKLQEILKAANRSSEIANQLLAFSRRGALQPQQGDLNDLVVDIGKALVRLMGENVRLRIRPDSRPCPARLDPVQFQQALIHLAVNARDAMPHGGELTIETSRVESDDEFAAAHPAVPRGRYVVVTVRDTGCGMDEQARSKLFEPFFTTKGVGQGAGLGLAMIHGFVQQSGGAIEVESEPNQGSTFRLYFEQVEAESPPLSPAAETAAPVRGSGTILVVEDEEPVREVIVASLREAGYVVLDAPSAAEALRLGEQYDGSIDMLITDVVMPGMSGPAMSIRFRELRPEIPVLFVSGYGNSELSKSGIDENEGLLVKPVSHEALLAKVNQMLAAAGKSRAPKDAPGNPPQPDPGG